MGDQEMVDYLAHALQEPASPRPSIETLLHGFLPATAVIHTHADAVVSLTNNDRSRDVLREVYGDEVIALVLPAARLPDLARGGGGVRGASEGARHPAREARDDLLGGLGEGGVRGHHRADQPRRGGHRPPGEGAYALRRCRGGEPARGGPAAGRARGGPPPAGAGGAEPAAGAHLRRRARRAGVRGLARGGRALPDRARHPRPHHLHQAPAVLRTGLRPGRPGGGARGRHRGGRALRGRLHRLLRGAQHRGGDPHRSVPARDRGGRARALRGRQGPAHRRHRGRHLPPHDLGAGRRRPRSAGYVSFSAREAFDVEYWPLELYKLSLAPPEKELARRIALVTGGASGIGAGRGPAAGRRGRARAGGRSRRGGGAQGRRGDRGRRTGRGGRSGSAWT